MTTDLTKTQLNTVLSALDGKPRNPNTKDAALKAIGRHAEAIEISIDDILTAAAGLLDERISPEEFRSSLQPDNVSKGNIPDKQDKPRRSREGTKQATMIAMLRRPEGATIEQIAEATAWQRHTIRGAISGALKKKLGLAVASEKPESGGQRVYRISG